MVSFVGSTIPIKCNIPDNWKVEERDSILFLYSKEYPQDPFEERIRIKVFNNRYASLDQALDDFVYRDYRSKVENFDRIGISSLSIGPITKSIQAERQTFEFDDIDRGFGRLKGDVIVAISGNSLIVIETVAQVHIHAGFSAQFDSMIKPTIELIGPDANNQ
jgi:hypothetical protein